MKLELHLPVTEPVRAADLLLANCDLSKQQIKQAMQKGAVWLTAKRSTQGTEKESTQRLRRITRDLFIGDEIHLYYDSEILQVEPPEPQLMVDNDSYSVWCKPAMMLSQGSKFGDHCAIARWVEVKTQKPCFIVHRLDRAASGLIVLAHTKQAAEKLSALFQQRKVKKHYRVCVEGKLEKENFKIEEPLEDKEAISIINTLKYDDNANTTLLDVEILTGRKHQIRKHLLLLGHPVVGDRLYGSKKDSRDLQLAAVSLAFQCPLSGKPEKIEYIQED